MKMIALKTQARKKDDVAKAVRAGGKVPCVLYGNDTKNTSFSCDYSEIFRVYSKAGESVLVELEVDSKKVPALFHKVDFAPVSDKIIHVDFYAVDMKKEIDARVPVLFRGESPVVKELGGVFVKVLDHLTVKCLPTDLPHHLEVSIDSLKEFGDALHVSDIAVPSGVTIDEDADSVIATVQEPRKEEEPVAAAEGEAGEAAEGEAGAEGEAKEGEPAEGGEAPAAEKKEQGEKKSE